MSERLAKAKDIVRKNWKPFVIGAGLTIVTVVVTRRLTSYQVLIGNGQTIRISKKVADSGLFYKVFNIYTPGWKHLGPSWMVQCQETGKSFRSINMAANTMGLDTSSLSRHLSGNPAFTHVHGYHFKKLGIAV